MRWYEIIVAIVLLCFIIYVVFAPWLSIIEIHKSQDVCDEDGHATKDAMIDIEVLTTYCREYGGHYLICADCYNSIRDFINSRHTKWGFPKGENPKVEATLSEEQAKDINDMTTDDIIQWCKNHQP